MRVKLALKEDHFEIESDVEMLDWPDHTLVARWWINGKSIIAPLAKNIFLEQEGRQVNLSHKSSVLFGYPDALNAKIGDTVSLQLMYVPSYRVLPEKEDLLMAENHSFSGNGSPMPMLSNKLDFILTDAFVRLREQNGK